MLNQDYVSVIGNLMKILKKYTEQQEHLDVNTISDITGILATLTSIRKEIVEIAKD